MFFDEIESLLSNNEFDNVFQLIDSQLNRQFDFNIAEDDTLFKKLNDYKESILEKLLTRYNELSIEEKNTRSKMDTYTVKRKVEIPLPPSRFIDALNHVRIKKYSDYEIPNSDSFITIISTKVFDKNLQELIGLPENKLSSSKSNTTFSTLGKNQKIFHNILTFSEEPIETMSLLKTFTELIEAQFNNEAQDVNILFVLGDERSKAEFQKITFSILLGQLCLLINAHNLPHSSLVTFLFDTERKKSLFEKTIIRLSDPTNNQKNISGYSPERTSNLARNALTQDPKYIAQLDSICRIVDEDDIPILVCGDTGVGKTFLAKIIHQESYRSVSGNYVDQNCGGLDSDSVDNILFGWKKGSFTGSNFSKKGKVEIANKGSLFLDEIHRTTPSTRNKLLTFIEDKKYLVRGEEMESTADVRLIFGTNKDLKKLIAKNEFEEDFYYRISSRIITIPPLRERASDIEIIVDYFLDILGSEKDKWIRMERSAYELLKSYTWLGNVRELHDYIKKLFRECIISDTNSITVDLINQVPLDSMNILKKDDLDLLIDLLKRFLSNWDISNGDILHKLIAPIIAKLYVDNPYQNWNKTKKYNEANKVVGMGGKEFEQSTLQKIYNDFPNIHNILGIDA